MIDDALERARAVIAAADPSLDTGALALLLYERWYHDAAEGRQRLYPDVAAYRAAALAAREFEPGWTLEAVLPAAGAVRARRGCRVRDVPPLAWVPEAPRRVVADPGDPLLAAPFRDGGTAGFWHLWSPHWPDRAPRRLRRWYLQPREGNELGLAMLLAAEAPLDRAWYLKLLSGPHGAGRRDGGVFYAPVARAAWIEALLAALAPCLDDAPPPPFTVPAGPGIAWADDPGDGLSFGQHRCRLLAEAARAAPEALADPSAWREAVAQAFAANALSLDAPGRARA